MTLPIATLLGLCAGAVIAITARRATVRELDVGKSRYFALSILYGIAVLTPAGIALYILFPDWSLMYLANPAHLPWFLVVPMMLLLYAGGPPVAFITVRRMLMMHSKRPLKITALIMAVVSFVVFVGGFHRLTHVAYYETWHHGDAPLSLFRSALFLPLILIGGAAVAVLVFTVLHIRRHLETAESPLEARIPEDGPEQSRADRQLMSGTHIPKAATILRAVRGGATPNGVRLRSAIYLFGVGLCACGPIQSTTMIVEASAELEAAQTAQADKHAPFELTAAEAYLHKAREEQSYSDFEESTMFAKKSRDCAKAARALADAITRQALGTMRGDALATPKCRPGPDRNPPIPEAWEEANAEGAPGYRPRNGAPPPATKPGAPAPAAKSPAAAPAAKTPVKPTGATGPREPDDPLPEGDAPGATP